ncbi:MAG TPA: hypothetical protein VGO31_11070 [Microbacteriaceae bacterium]|jgi:hypothetical protein|nr:hypothetical protein [Microbacteriaceae bacterium]
MWRTASLLAGTLAIAGVFASAGVAADPSAPFNQCPAVGADSSCALLIRITPSGQAGVYGDPSQGPFDGIEDTLVGVQNDSTSSIASIPISSSTGKGLFGFEGDGLCTFISCTWAAATGYEGPGVSFTNISTDLTSGTVVFSPAVPPGGRAYFSLEEALATVPPFDINPGPPNGVTAAKISDSASEPIMAINPTNPSNIVVAFNHSTSKSIFCGHSASFDGGKTWSTPSDLAVPAIRNLNPKRGGDPALAFTSSGKLFMACLTRADDTAIIDNPGPSVQMYGGISKDGGKSFAGSTTIVRGFLNNHGFGMQPDQESLTASGTGENVYLCYARTIATPGHEQSAIEVDRLDGSAHINAVGVVRITDHTDIGCTLSVAASGRLWVGWWDATAHKAQVSYSDNAASASRLMWFSAPQTLGDKRGDWQDKLEPRHVWVRASPSGNDVAALWQDDGSNGNNTMAAQYSGGVWAPSEQLFSHAFQPTLAWGSDGKLVVGFYSDTLFDRSSLLYSVAQFGSLTGIPSLLQVLPPGGPSSATSNTTPFGRFGDYTSVAEAGGIPYGAWTDNSGGASTVWFGHP